jgi:hypothetical protein
MTLEIQFLAWDRNKTCGGVIPDNGDAILSSFFPRVIPDNGVAILPSFFPRVIHVNGVAILPSFFPTI